MLTNLLLECELETRLIEQVGLVMGLLVLMNPFTPSISKKFIMYNQIFDRQLRIPGWNQESIRESVPLLLGVGGLGSSVLIGLLRLGVKKVFIVDYDKVEIHNLNRQMLFGLEDVGTSKVKAAIKNSSIHNVSGTVIEQFEGDAVLNWSKIVEMARKSTFVFNMIDYGDSFDLAVQSLAISLNIPLVSGGTFRTSLTVDFFIGKGCLFCCTDQHAQLRSKIQPSEIMNLKSLEFLPKNENPVGQSYAVVCVTCCQIMLSRFVEYVTGQGKSSLRTIFYTNSIQSITFAIDHSAKCKFCAPRQQLFRIIHFNDVYDLQPDKSGNAGIVNFSAFVQQNRTKNTLLLFSGDVFSPSLFSRQQKGKHMILPLNQLKISAACFGNHDFDFGHEQTKQLKKLTQFKWINSNLVQKQTGKLIGDSQQYDILYVSDLKIGVFSVCQQNVVQTFYEPDLIRALDAAQTAARVAKKLKNQLKCDYIIALTHSRSAGDLIIAQKVPQIDIILGGHDHVYFRQIHNQIMVLKSGSNFYQFTVNKFYHKGFEPSSADKLRGNYCVETQRISVTKHEKQNQKLVQHVQQLVTKAFEFNSKLIGFTDTQLDCKFQTIRTKESAISNFVSDLYRAYFRTDLAIINNGNIRHDVIIPVGQIKGQFLLKFNTSPVAVKEVTGKQLKRLLEEGVSLLPSMDGRFPGVSGMRFEVNSKNKALQKIQNLTVNGVAYEQQKVYTLAGNQWFLNGFDGYTTLKSCKFTVDPSHSITNNDMINKFLRNQLKDSRFSHLKKGVEVIEGEEYVRIGPVVQGRIVII